MLFSTAGYAVLKTESSVQQAAGIGQEEPNDEPNTQNAVVADPCQVFNIALHYTKGDLATYKVITENQRQALWEGSITQRPDSFVGGRTSSRVEVTFEQHILSVDEKGSAMMRIKITGIKCHSIVRDNVTLAFDSAADKDPNRPLPKLPN